MRTLEILGNEFRAVRLRVGLSQRELAAAAHVSRAAYSRIERGVDRNLTVVTASRIGAVLGLDVVAKAYPAGPPLRDAGHARLLSALLSNVRPPLRYRVEVPLPRNEERPEYRAWDAVIWSGAERTRVELETRLYDVQAQLRAFRGKLRDDPPDHFLLVVADTRTNRRVVADFPELLSDFPRERTANILAMLSRGQHPPTAMVLL